MLVRICPGMLARICNPCPIRLSKYFPNLVFIILRAMSEKYKIRDQKKAYFLTLTVVGWIDVFTRRSHKMTVVESLQYCQKAKGLTIFGYCLMPSHLHLLVRADATYTLSDIMRDFKKYTSKAIIQQITTEPESRRDWMLDYFSRSAETQKRITGYKLWQDGNHAEEITSNKFFNEKLEYIHNNPVEELIVERPEDYFFSSARNYAGLNNFLEVVLETVKQNKY
jgi:REP element-mobilizing transposase RayT